MSFSFAFDIDAGELDDQLDLAGLTIDRPEHPTASTSTAATVPHAAVPLGELLATLPPLLSYTPVEVPVSSTPTRSVTLLRRDLFDARFQILNQDEHDDDKGKQRRDDDNDDDGRFIDQGSDLVQGVYEGGLKTWECSLDLVDCLDQRGYSPVTDLDSDRVRGKSILELGCGTAVPTCALFARLLNEIRRSPTPPGQAPKRTTRIHLQDYNKQVLSLITLPNLLLTYAHHVILTRASSSPPDADADADDDDDRGNAATLQFKGPGELDVTPELLEAFEALLAHEGIVLEFSEGDWSGMTAALSSSSSSESESESSSRERGFDIVLTSETVYSLPSLPALLDVLQAAATAAPREAEDRGEHERLCLVACKRIYFGVGGGELEFRKRVEERGGRVESVWGQGTGKGKSEGVGRTVLKVEW
ncbi:hypothetical protein JCM11491_004963 [Sporobolomyces phaffii]